MAITAIVHLQGEDAFVADMDQLPNPSDQFLMFRNLRRKNGQPVNYVTDGATAFIYSWNRITFIELMGEVEGVTTPAKAVAPAGTTVLSFFREDDN